MKKSLKVILVFSVLMFLFLVFDAHRAGKWDLFTKNQVKQVVNTVTKKTQELSATEVPISKIEKQDHDVRVLIMTTDFASLYHQQVVLSSDSGLVVKEGGKKKTYKKEEKLTYKLGDSHKKVTITDAEGGKVKIESITRKKVIPAYRGKIELNQKKEGFTVVNQLPVEHYLYSVIPSELSTDSQMEALKAQAVCARTYAYNQIANHKYKKYNADLVDSVECQVYNNVPADKRAKMAVDRTKGQVIVTGKKKKRIEAYYYSTSWGKSATGKEVWNTKETYLKSCVQTDHKVKEKDYNLSSEEKFRDFMKNNKVVTYDKDSPWYRWQVSIKAGDLAKCIDTRLASVAKIAPDQVLVQQADGTYKKKALTPVGEIKKVRVDKRGASGVATEISIVGSKAVVKVCNQYNIRQILDPGPAIIHRQKGDVTYTMLPSAAIYIDMETQNNELIINIHGGGFGHGTGMSQYGATVMADAGVLYQDILKFYFSKCEVVDQDSKR